MIEFRISDRKGRDELTRKRRMWTRGRISHSWLKDKVWKGWKLHLNRVFPSELRHPGSPHDGKEPIKPHRPGDRLQRRGPANLLLLLRDVQPAHVAGYHHLVIFDQGKYSSRRRHNHLVFGERLQLVDQKLFCVVVVVVSIPHPCLVVANICCNFPFFAYAAGQLLA